MKRAVILLSVLMWALAGCMAPRFPDWDDEGGSVERARPALSPEPATLESHADSPVPVASHVVVLRETLGYGNMLMGEIADAENLSPGVIARLSPPVLHVLRDQLAYVGGSLARFQFGTTRDAQDLVTSFEFIQGSLEPNRLQAFWGQRATDSVAFGDPRAVNVVQHARRTCVALLSKELHVELPSPPTSSDATRIAAHRVPRQSDAAVELRLRFMLGMEVSSALPTATVQATTIEARQANPDLTLPRTSVVNSSLPLTPASQLASQAPVAPTAVPNTSGVTLSNVSAISSIVGTAYNILKPAASAAPCDVVNVVKVIEVSAEAPEFVPALGEVVSESAPGFFEVAVEAFDGLVELIMVGLLAL